MFSLGTIIDDILLIVRNNNISESEDLSRAQIATWITNYRARLIKQKIDQESSIYDDDYFDESLLKVVELEIENTDLKDVAKLTVRQTKDKITDLYQNDRNYIVYVTDSENCPIQFMHGVRRHFHYFRKYTVRELTYDYKNERILIQGNIDSNQLKYITVKYISSFDDSKAESEDDIKIPEWMVPEIKDLIFKNELAFMIKMPSDDDNNSTLDGIKPHGPQDQEK